MFSGFNAGAIGVRVGFEEAVELAAHHGFEGVYIDTGYLLDQGAESVVYMLEERNLRPAGWNLPVRLSGAEQDFEAGLQKLPPVAEAASFARALRCCTWLPPASDEKPYREMFDTTLDRLNRVGTILADNEIRLGLEFIGPLTSRAGKNYEFIYDMEEMLALCRAVETGNVGLLLDSWHLYTSGGTMDDVLKLTDHDVIDVHVNDAPEKQREEQIDNQRRLPGETGVIDARLFLKNLSEIAYTGPVMVEPFSERLKAMEDDDAIVAAKKALDDVWPD